MLKKGILLFFSILTVATLIAAIIFTLNGGKDRSSFKSDAASGQIDMLDYFISDFAIGKSSTPKSTGITEYVSGNSEFIAKSNSQYQYLTWDANNIYMKQDTSVGNFPVAGGIATSYILSPGTWAKRFMSIGESFNAPAEVKWYDNNCKVITTWPNWEYTITLEGKTTLNLGGEMGKQNVIIVKFDYKGPHFERYYYSKTWGWVKWEEVDPKTGKLARTALFNRVSTNFLTVKAKCGTPQPNLKPPDIKSDPKVKTPPPIPTPSPVPTPSPSPNPAPSPSPATQNSTCPNSEDASCFDCNEDNEVNILDFVCFRNAYGREI